MHTPMFSLEVFPPKRDAPVGTIYDTLDGLEGLSIRTAPPPRASPTRSTGSTAFPPWRI